MSIISLPGIVFYSDEGEGHQLFMSFGIAPFYSSLQAYF